MTRRDFQCAAPLATTLRSAVHRFTQLHLQASLFKRQNGVALPSQPLAGASQRRQPQPCAMMDVGRASFELNEEDIEAARAIAARYAEGSHCSTSRSVKPSNLGRRSTTLAVEDSPAFLEWRVSRCSFERRASASSSQSHGMAAAAVKLRRMPELDAGSTWCPIGPHVNISVHVSSWAPG